MDQIIAAGGSILRQGITAAGASWVAHGVMTGAQLDVVAGSVVALVGVGLSIIRNRYLAKKLG